MELVPLSTPIPWYYVGPSLDKGPLPAIFYFALSAQESLMTDPFNQPLAILKQYPVRIFSCDLPFHGEHMQATVALEKWASHLLTGDFLSAYFEKIVNSIDFFQQENLIKNGKIAVSGLSRGGFVAAHIAARMKEVSILLGYAPLTKLSLAKEFRSLPHDLTDVFNLDNLVDPLSEKTIRMYIGNRDARVSTDACYNWIRSLVEIAFEKKIRSLPIELILKPSIGYLGHGTSQESFEEGAKWILYKLGLYE